MEAKTLSDSQRGIGRIFSRSISEAISNKKKSPTGSDKSSRSSTLPSPDGEKKIVPREKSQGAPEICGADGLCQSAPVAATTKSESRSKLPAVAGKAEGSTSRTVSARPDAAGSGESVTAPPCQEKPGQTAEVPEPGGDSTTDKAPSRKISPSQPSQDISHHSSQRTRTPSKNTANQKSAGTKPETPHKGKKEKRKSRSPQEEFSNSACTKDSTGGKCKDLTNSSSRVRHRAESERKETGPGQHKPLSQSRSSRNGRQHQKSEFERSHGISKEGIEEFGSFPADGRRERRKLSRPFIAPRFSTTGRESELPGKHGNTEHCRPGGRTGGKDQRSATARPHGSVGSATDWPVSSQRPPVSDLDEGGTAACEVTVEKKEDWDKECDDVASRPGNSQAQHDVMQSKEVCDGGSTALQPVQLSNKEKDLSPSCNGQETVPEEVCELDLVRSEEGVPSPPVNSKTEGDEDDVFVQPQESVAAASLNLAKKRQASVSTRMRGNSRVKSGSARRNTDGSEAQIDGNDSKTDRLDRKQADGSKIDNRKECDNGKTDNLDRKQASSSSPVPSHGALVAQQPSSLMSVTPTPSSDLVEELNGGCNLLSSNDTDSSKTRAGSVLNLTDSGRQSSRGQETSKRSYSTSSESGNVESHEQPVLSETDSTMGSKQAGRRFQEAPLSGKNKVVMKLKFSGSARLLSQRFQSPRAANSSKSRSSGISKTQQLPTSAENHTGIRNSLDKEKRDLKRNVTANTEHPHTVSHESGMGDQVTRKTGCKTEVCAIGPQNTGNEPQGKEIFGSGTCPPPSQYTAEQIDQKANDDDRNVSTDTAVGITCDIQLSDYSGQTDLLNDHEKYSESVSSVDAEQNKENIPERSLLDSASMSQKAQSNMHHLSGPGKAVDIPCTSQKMTEKVDSGSLRKTVSSDKAKEELGQCRGRWSGGFPRPQQLTGPEKKEQHTLPGEKMDEEERLARSRHHLVSVPAASHSSCEPVSRHRSDSGPDVKKSLSSQDFVKEEKSSDPIRKDRYSHRKDQFPRDVPPRIRRAEHSRQQFRSVSSSDCSETPSASWGQHSRLQELPVPAPGDVFCNSRPLSPKEGSETDPPHNQRKDTTIVSSASTTQLRPAEDPLTSQEGQSDSDTSQSRRRLPAMSQGYRSMKNPASRDWPLKFRAADIQRRDMHMMSPPDPRASKLKSADIQRTDAHMTRPEPGTSRPKAADTQKEDTHMTHCEHGASTRSKSADKQRTDVHVITHPETVASRSKLADSDTQRTDVQKIRPDSFSVGLDQGQQHTGLNRNNVCSQSHPMTDKHHRDQSSSSTKLDAFHFKPVAGTTHAKLSSGSFQNGLDGTDCDVLCHDHTLHSHASSKLDAHHKKRHLSACQPPSRERSSSLCGLQSSPQELQSVTSHSHATSEEPDFYFRPSAQFDKAADSVSAHAGSDKACMEHISSSGVAGNGSRQPMYSQSSCSGLPQYLSNSVNLQAANSHRGRNRHLSNASSELERNRHLSNASSELERNRHLSNASSELERLNGPLSSSSECVGEILSQSDYDDFPTRAREHAATKVVQGTPQPNPYHSVQEGASDMYWSRYYSDTYQNQGGCYPPYSSQPGDQMYPPHPPGLGEGWDPYYEQWCKAWMAYSMAYYGYGFQDQELTRGLGGDQHDLDGDCNSVFHHHQSRPSSQPPSRPPSRAHPSVDNPSHREKSPSRPDNSCDRRQDDGGGGVPTTGRAPDTEDREAIRIPSHSIQTVSSAHHLLEYVHKQTVEASGKPDVSFELIVRMKNEGKGSGSPEEKTSPAADSTDSREAKITPTKADHTPCSKQSSGDEWSRMALPPEGPTQALSQFWRFRPRTFSPGLMRPGCRGDYPWPPGPQFPRPMLAAPVDPYRFYVPRVPGGRPKFASAVSDSGREELREGAARQRYPTSTYDEWNDLPPFPTSSTYYGDPTAFYNLPPPPPPPSSPYPGVRAAMNSGPETSSSEVCPLDSSLDTRGDYDASSSDLEDDDGGQASIAKPPNHSQAPYSYFVAAQRERYFQMYKDSGSEECDSPTSPLLPSTHTSTAQDTSASTGRYLPPHKRQNCGQGLSHFLQRRHIPSVNRNPTTSVNRNPMRRSCPPAVETAPGVSSDSGLSCASRNVQWGRGLMNTPPPVDSSTNMVPSLGGWGRGVATPPDDSCSNTFTSPGGWWDNSRKNDTVVYNEDFPALGTSPSQASDLAGGSYASMAATSTNPQQPGSFRVVKEDGTCKTFFRKKPFIMVDSSSPLPASSCGRGASSYSSRLLNDNRLTGSSRWGKEAKEAFFRQYQTPYVDTHCHLDFLFNREPYSGTFASYRDKKKTTFPGNFEGCVAVFCNPKSFTNESKWKPIVEEPRVWMAMGCHPKSAVDYTEWAEMGLRKCLKHKKTVALGEIGLDYSKHHGQTAAKQKEVFIRQIKIALEMQLPLVIHSREAEDDCLEILEELVPSDYKIHCHCFTSNYNSALKWTSRFENLFIGLTPLVTYRSAVETHDVARNIPLNKLLLETDAPYFFPCGFDGEGPSLSHPGMALMVAIKVAELRNITVEEVLSHVRRNTRSMYGV